MKIKITPKFSIAFMALTFVMLELHEIVHTAVGRIICGCWGNRDFNAWDLCRSCENVKLAWLSTLAGPVFTFIMIWIGAGFLKKSNKNQQKSFGLALLFSNAPFGRILNPLLKCGDEATLINNIIGDLNYASLATLLIILLITAYPLYKAYKTIQNKPVLFFILFFFVPVALIILVVLILLNSILAHGVLSGTGILGSPVLVNLWTVFVLIIFMVFRKHLYQLGKVDAEIKN